jgi:hypothetical protein
MGGRFLSVLTQSEGSLTTALPTVQPLALTSPVGSISHSRRAGSNVRDPSAMNIRVPALIVSVVTIADTRLPQSHRS